MSVLARRKQKSLLFCIFILQAGHQTALYKLKLNAQKTHNILGKQRYTLVLTVTWSTNIDGTVIRKSATHNCTFQKPATHYLISSHK